GARLQALTPRQIAWRRFRRHKPALVSTAVLIIIVLMCVFQNWIQRHPPNEVNLIQQFKGPSGAHWFGTDYIGRDLFARVLSGGRISLMIGISVALFSGIIGTLFGALAGYYGRWVDQTLMRFTDLFLAIPFLVVLIIATSVTSGSVFSIILILTLFFWMPNARIVRGVV